MTAKMVTLHVFRQLSPDQPRGLSWFMTVLLALSDLNQTLYQRPFGLTLLGFPWNALADRAAPEFIEQDADEGKTPKTRLDWPSDFKDEVLARLLALNATRAAEERAAGLVVVDDGDDEDVEEGDTE